MGRYLLTYSDNWADEMDIDGHIVLSEKKYLKFKKALEECEGFYFSVGSNQGIKYDDAIDVEYVIDVQELTEEDYKVLNKLDLLSVGFAEEFVSQLIDSIESNEDEEDDEWGEVIVTREELEELGDKRLKKMAEYEFSIDTWDYHQDGKLDRDAVIEAILAVQEEEEEENY